MTTFDQLVAGGWQLPFYSLKNIFTNTLLPLDNYFGNLVILNQ